MLRTKEILGFDWDKGNIGKNKKHDVDDREAEEVFFDENKRVYKDILHSTKEERYIILGKNKQGRLLYTVFTIRDRRIRIISSRDISKKEVILYEKST